MDWTSFEMIGYKIEESVKEKLIKFKNLLQEENKKYNLTTIINDQDIIYKHFFDSLLFTKDFELNTQKVLDIGTGAGFPGIVLKIFYPMIELHLVESNSKKVSFLKMVINNLNLKNIYVWNERAEVFSLNNKEKFDITVSRAMAPLNILLEIGVQALTINGYFICLKGKNVEKEILELNNKEYLIGLKLLKEQNLYYEFLGERTNLFFLKENKTANQYPRQYGQIKKRPLGK